MGSVLADSHWVHIFIVDPQGCWWLCPEHEVVLTCFYRSVQPKSSGSPILDGPWTVGWRSSHSIRWFSCVGSEPAGFSIYKNANSKGMTLFRRNRGELFKRRAQIRLKMMNHASWFLEWWAWRLKTAATVLLCAHAQVALFSTLQGNAGVGIIACKPLTLDLWTCSSWLSFPYYR